MLSSHERRLWIGVAALLLAGSPAALAGGAPTFYINRVAAFDGNWKIFNTDAGGNRVGAPIVNRDFKKGETIKGTVTGNNKDFSEDWVEKGGTRTASLDNGIVIPNPGNPAQVIQADYTQAVAAGINVKQPVTVPILGSGTTQVFGAVDMLSYFNSGGTPPPDGMTISITNGTSSMLPGMVFGLSPIAFDPNSGYVNSNPFTGDVTVFGTSTLSAVPEPSSIVMLVMGVGVVTAAIVRSRRAAAA